MAEKQPISVGCHIGFYEPPDLLILEFRGDVTAEHVAAYVDLRARLLEGQPRILTLIDARGLCEPPAETRAAVARLRDPRPQATAILGANFRQRVMAEFVVKAAHLFTGKLIRLGFFEDVDAARAWLLETRPKL